MQLPSNKVGFILVFVVLCVASTIFFSKVQKNTTLKDLSNVDLLVVRNTDAIAKSGDGDLDGLADWQEELWKSDKDNPDTDGDGTSDGDEIAADRDPSIPGPNDKLVQPSDYFQSDVDFSNFASGTVSDRLSIDLFAKYLNLKQQGTVSVENQEKLVTEVSQKATADARLQDNFDMSELSITGSTKETVSQYGTDFAQISISYLATMDSYKSLSESQYVSRMAAAYKDFATAMADIAVPTVAQDIHIQIVNQLWRTGIMFETVGDAEEDPLRAMVVIGQYEAGQKQEAALYTSLADYFKTNGIIFNDDATVRFWNYFAS